jgi:hypothetical protein
MGYAGLRLSKVVVAVGGSRGSSAESNGLGCAARSGLESALGLWSVGSSKCSYSYLVNKLACEWFDTFPLNFHLSLKLLKTIDSHLV